MRNVNNVNSLPFYPLVLELENVLGYTEDIMELISLINRKQFNTLRNNIIRTFQIGDVKKYDGVFGGEVEFGDVCDAVRVTTSSRYPESTPTDKPISREERLEWCHQILDEMDNKAATYL